MTNNNQNDEKKLNWARVLLSVCSAFFGVQSDKNLTTDFTSGRVWPFIIIGLVVVTVFVVGLILIVKLVVL